MARIVPVAFLLLLICSPALPEGEFGPWVFIHGVHDPAIIDQLPSLGCNVAYVTPEVVDSIGLGACSDLVDRAAAYGINSIIAIPTTLAVPGQPPSVGGQGYRQWVENGIRQVMERFQADPNVIAWATGDLLEESIDYNEADFRAFLRGRYGSIETLNAAWGASFADWGNAAQFEARRIDDTMPFGVGRASLDVADYRRQAFHDVMQHWARTIKALDPARPLLTGRLSLYRSCTAVPPEYDIVCPWASPAVLEPDTLAHNMHAVAISRRAGKFAVIPCLDIPQDESQVRRGDLQRWIGLAGLSGACGVGLVDWARLQASPASGVVMGDIARAVAPALSGETFRVRPRAGFAMLCQSYAGGATTELGTAYGFVDGPAEGEPGAPFGDFRLGCRFGFPDYVTLDDLPAADLSRYSAVIAPAALSLPDSASRQLSEYVRAGGAFVTDLGAGLYQTGSWLILPQAIASAAGVRELVQMREEKGANLRVSWSPPWLPSLIRGSQTRGTYREATASTPRASVSSGLDKRRESSGPASQAKAWHVAGPACFADLEPGAGAVAVLTTSTRSGKRVIAGLVGGTAGDGVALMATHQLWANWESSDPVYASLHQDLLAARPAVELIQGPFWTAGVCATATRDGIAVFNGTGSQSPADVIAYEASHALHGKGVCTFSALARKPDGTRSGAVQVSLDVAPMQTVLCTRTSVTLQPYEGTCSGRLLECSERRVVFELAGDGAPIRPGPGGILTVGSGENTSVRLRITDSPYPVGPASAHSITLDHGQGRVERLHIRAGTSRALEATFSVRRALVTVQPVPG